MEISHVFRYSGYTLRQRFIIWLLYMSRFFIDILTGVVGILTLGIIQVYLSADISEKILRNQLKFYKEKKK